MLTDSEHEGGLSEKMSDLVPTPAVHKQHGEQENELCESTV